MLGEQVTSCHNLAHMKSCDDGSFIQDVVAKLPNKGRECLVCCAARGDGAHWSHDCPVSQPDLAQRDLNVSAALALLGYTFWFEPSRRWPALDSRTQLLARGFAAHQNDGNLLVAQEQPGSAQTFTVPVTI